MRKTQLFHLTKLIEGKHATTNCEVLLNCEASDNDSCYPTLQKLQEDIIMGTSWELHANSNQIPSIVAGASTHSMKHIGCIT